MTYDDEGTFPFVMYIWDELLPGEKFWKYLVLAIMHRNYDCEKFSTVTSSALIIRYCPRLFVAR